MQSNKSLFFNLLSFLLIGATVHLANAQTSLTQEQKITALEEKVALLQHQFELIQARLDPAIPDAKAHTVGVVTADGTGFSIQSPDRNFQIRIGGNLTANGRFYADSTDPALVDSIFLRKVRPSLQGTMFKFLDFRIMPDFAQGAAVLQDAYVEARFHPRFAVRAGKFKPPVGLERLEQDTDIWFIERGLPTGLVPNRDVGYQISGDIKSWLNYAVGVFDGSPDGALLDQDTNNGKDYEARLFATPLSGLGFGISGTTGNQTGTTLASYKTFSQATFFTYAGNVSATGARNRISPQAYYFHGPLGLLAEYVRSDQDVRKGNLVTKLRNTSWGVEGAWLLTGEHKTYKIVVPRKVFDPIQGGWGAWELLVRAGDLTLDPKVYALDLADHTKSAQKAQEWAFGLNWYPNRAFKMGVNYGYTRFTGGAAAGDRAPEKSVLSIFQIIF